MLEDDEDDNGQNGCSERSHWESWGHCSPEATRRRSRQWDLRERGQSHDWPNHIKGRQLHRGEQYASVTGDPVPNMCEINALVLA